MNTRYSKTYVKSFIRKAVKEYGFEKAARDSGIARKTISQWVYGAAAPGLDKAIKLLNAIGYETNIKSVDEFRELVKANKAAVKKSGVNMGTVNSWLYTDRAPTLDKAMHVLEAIGKPFTKEQI